MDKITVELPKADTSATGMENIIGWVLGAAGLIAVGVIVYGAIKFLTAQGQPDKIRQAKQIIAFALIGLVVVALAFAIVNFVFSLAGNAAGSSSETASVIMMLGGIA